MKTYKVTFEVPNDRLETIVGLLSGEISNMHIDEVVANAQPFPNLPRIPEDRVKWAMPYAKDILAAMLPDKEYSAKSPELVKAIEAKGLAASSLSSLFSVMYHKRRIRKIKRGVYVKN